MFATSIASVSSHFWHHYARTISDAYRPIALVGVIRLERKRCHLGRVGRQPLADAKAYSLNEKDGYAVSDTGPMLFMRIIER